MLKQNEIDSIYSRLGELIREARKRADVKQELLASFLDLSRISISNIENGKQKIQLHTLIEIAKYLQIPISDLLEPLNNILVDNVTSKQLKRINNSMFPQKIDLENNVQEFASDKIKEFLNFVHTKNNG